MRKMTRREALRWMTLAGMAAILHPGGLAAKTAFETELNEFETDFATAALAIDLLWGGDIHDPSGIKHVIVDAYTSGKKQPEIVPGNLRKLFLEKGTDVTDREAIQAFLKQNTVETRLERIGDYADRLQDPWRKAYLKNLAAVLKVHLNLRKSMAGLAKPVPLEEAYGTAFGRAPYFIETGQKIDRLRQCLAKAGIEKSKSMSLADAVGRWSGKRLLDAKGIEEKWKPFQQEMVKITREKIFPYLPKYATQIPEDVVDFGILWQSVSFSGLNLAQHTMDRNGNPVFKTIVRMSSQIQRAEADYKFNLVAHEGWPGHGLHLPLLHLLYARQSAGFETTLFVLSSAAALLAEGIASATAYLLYGHDLETQLGADEQAAVALADLSSAGRNNIAVKFIQGERNLNGLAGYLNEECGVPLSDAARSSRWLNHPLFGIMYLPAYGIGAEMIRNAVKTYGREKVIPVAYGTQGQIDGITFPERMARFSK